MPLQARFLGDIAELDEKILEAEEAERMRDEMKQARASCAGLTHIPRAHPCAILTADRGGMAVS